MRAPSVERRHQVPEVRACVSGAAAPSPALREITGLALGPARRGRRDRRGHHRGQPPPSGACFPRESPHLGRSAGGGRHGCRRHESPGAGTKGWTCAQDVGTGVRPRDPLCQDLGQRSRRASPRVGLRQDPEPRGAGARRFAPGRLVPRAGRRPHAWICAPLEFGHRPSRLTALTLSRFRFSPMFSPMLRVLATLGAMHAAARPCGGWGCVAGGASAL